MDDALTYYTIAREVLGPEWTEHGLLRFGASRLADNVATALLGESVRLAEPACRHNKVRPRNKVA